ncbi:hypothetical protein R84981_001253 [Carnimonas sp. R-84981]|uniref:TetR/AcrR family transcriptional regulator n=1 Tax=Carnimonas bestiolae TaxID=3402172 RepID=UPI003EDBC118
MVNTQKQRYEQRREALLSIARKIMGERGLSSTNVRVVAEEAKVSVGSVLYYFDGFDDLIDTAIEGAMDEFIRRRQVLIEREPDPQKCLWLLIQHGIPAHISENLRVIYEISPLMKAKPRYCALLRLYLAQQVSLYRQVIDKGVASGHFHLRLAADVIADNILALEDGYDLYLMDRDNHKRDHYLHNTLSFASLALGCDLFCFDDEEAAHVQTKTTCP